LNITKARKYIVCLITFASLTYQHIDGQLYIILSLIVK